MAGAPPPEWGGNREFLNDPQMACLSTMMGDMAAMNLQCLHVLGADVVGPGRVILDRMAATARQVLEASTASRGREQSTREMRPISVVPVPQWGDTAAIGNIRMFNVPVFTGGSSDTIDVVRWIAKIFSLAEANLLTYGAAINLLIQGSSGGAADYIEQMRTEGKTLIQIVQQLEMRYGDLCTPEEAKVKVNTMARKEDEGLSEFIDRLRRMARMALRLMDDEVARTREIDTLVEGNIRRAIPPSVRNALEERVVNRKRMGLPPFSARELEKECLDLEKRREERKTQPSAAGVDRRFGKIQRLGHDILPDASDSSESSDEEPEGDDAMHHLIKEVRQQHQRYAQQGRRVEPQKVFKRAFNSFNKKPNRFQQGGYPYGARQAGQVDNPMGNSRALQGPPNRINDNQRTIFELLALANVERGCCIQCGQRGHILRQDGCALRDKNLTDKPCAKCGQGLHSADECLRVFQRQYVAQPPQPENPVNSAQTQVKDE